MAKKKIAAKKETNKKTSYIATAVTFGKKFIGKGDTVFEALSNITPGQIHGRVIITLESGDRKKDRVLNMVQGRRLFNMLGLTREIALKNATMLFQGFDV